MPTVREIVRFRLITCCYDGLYLRDECGCPLRDLMPCGQPSPQCAAGYKKMSDDGDWVIGPKEEAR